MPDIDCRSLEPSSSPPLLFFTFIAYIYPDVLPGFLNNVRIYHAWIFFCFIFVFGGFELVYVYMAFEKKIGGLLFTAVLVHRLIMLLDLSRS
ncbi:hypothetical protein BDV28DRAFT_136853 [Aspergillus coremiiformis]|uniref:Uncharacterized protein n=1 Tax=Aspergillus coremiiformis TaxID=138285 RepID=A0A5N6Z1L4_9EURO|nr:hypothetical protein BDV28DRAFT_136853 [Aspergillus coremiiformis]